MSITPLHRHQLAWLTDAGCNFSGWSLTAATGISFDGLTLCGEGVDPQGLREAWIATVPSPAGAGLGYCQGTQTLNT